MSLEPQDRNTDKYYKSKNPGSAIQQSAADSTRKPRQKLPPGYSPVKTPTFNKDDQTTSKYYANGGSAGAAVAGRPMPEPKLPFVAVDPASGPGHTVVLVEIPNAAALGEGVALAKAHAKAGRKIEIGVGDKELIARVQTALDGAVSREEITEDQRRQFRIGLYAPGAPGFQNRRDTPPETRSPDEMFGAPVARGTKSVAANPDDDLDIDAFLAGGAIDAEDEKLAALTGGTATGGAPPAPEPEPEEDNEFLNPSPEPADAVTTTDE